MAQKSKIQIAVETKGTQKAAKDIENVGRAQTRLGQASASTSRQFSAQASGLGGFVAAYAGAAANVFALQQAFAALQKVAQFETVIRGTRALAAEIGQSGDQILASVKNITDGQIALEEAAQNVNIALSAGLGRDQIEDLTDISFKASRALGRNLTDALQRVVRGTAKLEPELLDELGIFARIDPAVEAYAAKLNVAASSLTNYEKRQAFANAVIEEGQKKFSAIATNVESAQASFEKFLVQIQELAIGFGQGVTTILKPFVDFLGEGNNALLAFLAIISLVFGKALQVIGGFATNALAKLGTFATGAAEKATIASANIERVVGAFGGARDRRGLSGFQSRIAGQQNPAEARELASTIKAQESGQLKNVAALKAANKVYEKNRDLLDSNSKRYKVLNDVIRLNNAAITKAGGRTAAYSAIANVTGLAVRGLTVAFAGLRMAVGGLFAAISVAQLVGSFFDVDIIQEIKEFFTDMSVRAENLKVTVAGLAVTMAGGGKAFEILAVRANITKKRLEELDGVSEDVAGTLNKGLLRAIDGSGRAGRNAAKFFEETVKPLMQMHGVGTLAAKGIAALQKELEGTDDALKKLVLEQTIAGLIELGDAALIVGPAARLAGISGQQVTDAFKDLEKQGMGVINVLQAFGADTEAAAKGNRNLSERTTEVITSVTLFANVLRAANKEFLEGSTSSEKLSKQLSGMRSNFEKLHAMGPPTREAAKALAEMAAEIEKVDGRLRELKTAEAITKGLTDNFGKFIKAADAAAFSGVMNNLEGLGKEAAQFARLQQVIIGGAATGDAQDAVSKERRDAANKAMKILYGMSLQLPAIIKKRADAEEKVEEKLRGQLAILKEQNTAKRIQLRLSEQQATDRRENTAAAEAVKLLEAQKKLQEELGKAKQQELDFQKQMNQLNHEALMQQRELAEIGMRSAAAGAQGGRESGIRGAQAQLADMQAFPNLNTLESIRQKQEEIINRELDNQLKIIAEKERVAKFEAETARENLREAIRQNMAERAAKQEELATLVRVQEQERVIAEANAAMEQNKIRQEGERLKIQAELIGAQARAAQSQNDVAEKARQAAVARQKLELNNLKIQVDTVEKFQEALNQENLFTKTINAFLAASNRQDLIVDPTQFKAAKIVADFAELEKQIDKNNALARQGYLERNQAITDEFASKTRINQLDQSANSALLLNIQKRQSVEAEIARTANATARKALENEAELLTKKIDGQFKEFNIIDANEKAKLEALAREKAAAQDNAKARQDALDRERDLIRNVLDDISEKIQNRLGGAVEDFFGAIREGTLTMENFKQGVKDLFVGILEDVTTSVTEQFVINPIKEFIKGQMGNLASMFGGGASPQQAVVQAIQNQTGVSQQIAQTAQNNLKDIFDKQMSIFEGLGMDVQRVQVVGGIGGIGSPVLVQQVDAGLDGTSLDLAGQTRSLRKLDKQQTEAVNTTKKQISADEDGILTSQSLAGEQGVLATKSSDLGFSFENLADFAGMAGAGLGALAGGLIGGPAGSAVGSIVGMIAGEGIKMLASSFFPAASGGVVRHMAAGGALRDRVPAMLEPGEFVIRKPMAKAIGGPALNAMNAHGTMPNSPNVVVNMNNQGTPQESEGKPNVQVTPEAIIVDIVTRDMQNNGPIRRSIRGNLS